jgi:hypothetical protein
VYLILRVEGESLNAEYKIASFLWTYKGWIAGSLFCGLQMILVCDLIHRYVLRAVAHYLLVFSFGFTSVMLLKISANSFLSFIECSCVLHVRVVDGSGT